MSAPERPAGWTGAQPPQCYRHPGRETYIRCSRCDRPICPDCMVSAAVGFQCPDCVAEGRRTAPTARTTFGGTVRGRQSLVTTALIAACVAAFAAQIAVPSLTGRFWLLGLEVAGGSWYRLITVGFLHASVLHLLFNMWALWVVGRPLEALLGRSRFLTLYAGSLVGGSTASYLFGNPGTPALGASGAIFGLFGGMLVVARRMHWNLGGIVAIVAINLALPLFSAGIDWHAHVGGLIAGAVITAAMVLPARRVRPVAGAAACVLVVALCAGLVTTRSAQIRNDPNVAPLIGQLPEPDFRPSIQ